MANLVFPREPRVILCVPLLVDDAAEAVVADVLRPPRDFGDEVAVVAAQVALQNVL